MQKKKVIHEPVLGCPIIQGNGSSLISLHYTSHLNKTIFLSCFFAAACLENHIKFYDSTTKSSKREKDIKYNGLGACRSGEVANDFYRAAAKIFIIRFWKEIWLKYGASSLVALDGCYLPQEVQIKRARRILLYNQVNVHQLIDLYLAANRTTPEMKLNWALWHRLILDNKLRYFATLTCAHKSRKRF